MAKGDGLRARVRKGLRAIEGVDESPSQFGSALAWWVNGKEIAHFDRDGALDLRLGRVVIRERRLKADPRVALRRSGGDWIEVRLETGDDVAFALELCELAAAAHRAPAGAPPAPPPAGPALERRRRFH